MHPRASTYLRRRIGRFVVLALVALLLSPAGAHASEKSEAKKLKKALIQIEERLDVAKDQIRSLTNGLPQHRRELKELERQIPLMTAQTDTFSSFHVVGSLIGYTGLQVDEIASRHGIKTLKREIASLTDLRHRKIGDLQGLVIAAQREARTSPLIVGGDIVTYSADWEAVAMCESSGNWQIDAYFDGGLQFLPSTWIGFGGGELARYAYQATKTEQIAIAERVLAIQGPKAWPNCFHALEYGV